MKRTLLAVLAHPDDESYGLGGTLARYSAEGVDVHVAIATDGAAGSIDENWKGDHTRLVEARLSEVEAAAGVLGVKLHMLGYRDSGYVQDSANGHPHAFINADMSEAVGRVVHLIRDLKAQVVVTHDETGTYFHPDHIQCHKVATAAFFAASDPEQYPEVGIEPFQPLRLYYQALSKRLVKVFALSLRLQGQDPKRRGRNQDIDTTQLGVPPEKITTTIDYRKYWDVKRRASAEHGSQGAGTGSMRIFPAWLQKLAFSYETYIRAYPAVVPGNREKDLFASL
jgi:LmbE family N-acetylglucosaminyl deacetylase